MVDVKNPLTRYNQIPKKVALTKKYESANLSSQIEVYKNCASADFKLSAFTHHWIILQHNIGPDSMLIAQDGKEYEANSLTKDQIIYIPPFRKTEWDFSQIHGCTHILLPDSLVCDAAYYREDLELLHNAGAIIGADATAFCSKLKSCDFDIDLIGSDLDLAIEEYITQAANGLIEHVRSRSQNDCIVSKYSTGLLETQLKRVKEYMWDNLDHTIHVQDLASLSGMSLFYFSRCFKKLTGVSPHKYLTCMRIHKARTLLPKERNLAIIACLCGFADQAHFTRIFKMFTGITPHQFRKATS